ncbi:hypothetical protein OJ996_21985 [Luteolibacter sp. GHJ8]|uniref:DnaA-like protein n=1 Tax=Luteolibacter rhizosphaerae TaxID=2989719 RepID=A0ABT3G8Z0_9BACT|nr:hypothetical protein [Luteolibacter rhizosphaerae]MCW1916275.1 hypothetical protein [Luteolibacter rhizosphaerae]
MKTVLGDIRNEALLKLGQAMAAEVVARCVEAAARQAGCPWREIMGPTRGSPRAARGRVVAMLACVKMGVSPRMTARAFGRSRRAVCDAMATGRPGRARRDAAVMQDFEEVMGRIGKI